MQRQLRVMARNRRVFNLDRVIRDTPDSHRTVGELVGRFGAVREGNNESGHGGTETTEAPRVLQTAFASLFSPALPSTRPFVKFGDSWTVIGLSTRFRP